MSYTKHTKELIEKLTTLRNSCLEGADGSWDPYGRWTEDNEMVEGFEAMAENAERVAELVGVKLPAYVRLEEEN